MKDLDHGVGIDDLSDVWFIFLILDFLDPSIFLTWGRPRFRR